MNNVTLAIDFGTTRTKVAYYDERTDEPRLIRLVEQHRYDIPSLFYLPKQGGTILIGYDAQTMGESDPDGLVIGLKRDLHKPGNVRRGFGRETVERTKLASKLFDYIRNRCAKELGSDHAVPCCVLSVPSGFHEPQREALKQAAQLGGFTVTNLIDEAIAAAQAWLAESGKEITGNLLVVDVGFRLAGFTMVQYIDGNFRTSDAVLPTSFDARNRGVSAFEDRVVEQVRYFAEAVKKAHLEILLIGSGSSQSSLRSKIEGLNIAPLHVLKQAEFAVALGAATPIHLVVLRQRLAADLKEIDQAEQESLDLDFVLRRLSPQRAADWKKAAARGWPEGEWLVGACHFEKIDGWSHDKTVAARYFKQAAEVGFQKAYSSLATCYDEGDGVSYDPAKAVELWNAAAVTGDPIAALNLAAHYHKGRGVPADPVRSINILRSAADGGSAFARWFLGVRYLQGAGCESNENEAKRQFELAFNALEKPALKGGKSAQYCIGLCYLRGFGVQVNLPMAVEWISKSAEQGLPFAQETLADCYIDGLGIPVDAKKAVELLRYAANAGVAQAKLGTTLLSGVAGTVDHAEAFEWFRKSADRGNADGQYQLGRCFILANGVHENKPEGFGWIKRAAEQGHAQAQHDVGQCLLDGIGVQSNPQAAIPWLEKSSDQNCPDGISRLANCYYSGAGITQDKQHAAALFRKAAEMGHLHSMMWLGVILRENDVGPSDKVEAVSWFRRAAEQNHPGALCQLGLCYVDGIGLGKNIAIGWSHIQRAAEMGDSCAQSFVGNCWLVGDYVSKNDLEAVKWFNKAAAQGNFDGQVGLGKCYLHGWGGLPRDVQAAAKCVQQAADAGYPGANTILGKCYESGLVWEHSVNVKQDVSSNRRKWHSAKHAAAFLANARGKNDRGNPG
jgi:TPR repeat protein